MRLMIETVGTANNLITSKCDGANNPVKASNANNTGEGSEVT